VGSGANGPLTSIYMEGHSAGVVEFIFNGPVVSMQGEQAFRRGHIRREAGVGRFQMAYRTHALENLPPMRPITGG
jgi:hypothetical protein